MVQDTWGRWLDAKHNVAVTTILADTLGRLCYSNRVSKRFRLGVLGSGKGSNFAAIADAIAAGKIPAEVALVLSDTEQAGILSLARERQIPAQSSFPRENFCTKLEEPA